MKRLTINHVARASLKANRKAYISLAIGIFLAVYLAAAMSLGGYATVLAQERRITDMVGEIDCFMMDALQYSSSGLQEYADRDLRDSGLFDRIGHAYLTASVEETDVYMGYLDEEGASLLHRHCVEGRMPERAGEIALEQSVLEQLRLEAAVGDTVTWAMQPIDGVAEKRTYTIVGILSEQTTYLDISRNSFSSLTVLRWPAILTSAEEPAFSVGRIAVHPVMTYAPLTTYTMVENNLRGSTYAVSRTEGRVYFTDPTLMDAANSFQKMMLWVIMGSSLLLVSCVGISSAMESILARKTEEIGMLRAVGATRRQIKRVFGRDAWLLAALALPAGVILGALTAWLISLAAPEEMVFSLSPHLLIPIVLLSALCIFISSRLPLRRAARQTPLGVMRDIGMLRKAKKFKSKKQFRSTLLIAGRQARLHPFRQTGNALMVALMLLCMALLCELGFSMAREQSRTQPYDFNLSISVRSGGRYFTVNKDKKALTDQDLAQLRAIPQVDNVVIHQDSSVSMILEGEVPAYFRDFYALDRKQYIQTGFGSERIESYTQYCNAFSRSDSMNYLLMDEWDDASLKAAADDPFSSYDLFKQMQRIREWFDVKGKLVSIPLFIVDAEDEALQAAVSEGRIDKAALDAGREILVYAPDQYVGMDTKHDDMVYISPAADVDVPHGPWLAQLQSDYFHAGQAVNLLQLVDEDSNGWFSYDDEEARQSYAAMLRHDAHPIVGAVLKGENPVETWDGGTVAFYTTRKGAEALGLYLRTPHSIEITLKGDVSLEAEEAIQKRLAQIAMRADMTVYNRMASYRSQRQLFMQVIGLFIGMVLLFFAVSIAMQLGNTGRRIRADSRMIGTLRAVGADERALLGCYRLPAMLSAVMGLALGLIAYVLMWRYATSAFPDYHPAIVIPVMAVLAAVCMLCCLLGVRVRLRQVLNHSIVENIREL